ncbi:Hypothetical protein mma_2192 [Janthinobacterium sp. Marseille]|nr:hypothetical protein [Janthinobacterium sp. Marseille]ABR91676.1 Hypothetical protein mma_2192 [Janthinobacterium sp. Marseille]
MPRNGSGVYTLPAGNPVISGTSISSVTQNNTMSDVAAELTNSIAADGQKTPTADLPMGNFRHTGVSDGTARNQYASVGQTQDSALLWCGLATGTANDLTFSPNPAITAYSVGQVFRFQAASNNTAATTIAISGLSPVLALQVSGVACVGGELLANQYYEVFIDSTSTAQLRNVSKSVQSAAKIFSINGSVATNILTCTLNPVSIDFRSATLGSGVVNTRTVATAITVAVPDTATLGTTSATLSRLILLAIDNAGTVELAIGNWTSSSALDESGLISTTTVSTGADSANIFYSTTGRSNVPYRVVGFVESTQATAGTWATAPSMIQGTGGEALVYLAVPPTASSTMQSISTSVAGNALTVNAAATTIDFPNSSLTSGSPFRVAVPALSLVAPSGATFGATNAVQVRLILLIAYNAGTPVLCITNASNSTPLNEENLISPTTVGAGSTSANVIYSASTVSANSPYRVIGFIDITEATAGVYATDATLKRGYGGQILAQLGSFGYNQSYQSVTRTSGVTYYNPGKPFFGNIAGTSAAAVGNVYLSINGGVTFSLCVISPSSGYGAAYFIPANCSFVMTDSNIATRINVETR